VHKFVYRYDVNTLSMLMRITSLQLIECSLLLSQSLNSDNLDCKLSLLC